MIKKIALISSIALGIVNISEACTEVFIHKDNASVVGRTMDFPINIGIFTIGYNKGVHQVSSYMDKAYPDLKVAEWDVKYPFMGREIFSTGLLVDGANDQGLSASFLYLPGTEYPKYDPSNKKAVLSFYDLVNYTLATSKDVNEALENISKYQIISSSVAVAPDIALKDAPLHFSLRDKFGNSAVIEFINGKINVYKGEEAGNVLTNYPTLPEQLKNLLNYNSLINYNKDEQKAKFGNIPGFKLTIESSSLRDNIASMVGIPGDYSPPSRFVRATYLEKNVPEMSYPQDYKYMMGHILNSVTVPYSPEPNSTATQWQTIKDLNSNTISYKNILYLYNGKLIVAEGNENTYNIDQIFSTGLETIGASGKLQKKVTNPQDYNYYAIEALEKGLKVE
ncbi:linear amide C-N hydrolase [Francisella frigiditurris]|uniref:Linear amide C-N hydrolase, choloylglycine hydrolase family protein n=1 Tax=Francisella frigiditurris TaxID=1542390 RepID=A0A1J0KTW9_9GAMM|nr:linear amide C-N hydrolase [Francisella frigiditurris]APC97201.1 linear amide C-N hydrolase, choloylglycine hydrolase family protein [Francisella frigiditurris]